jgi:hypothetical protein
MGVLLTNVQGVWFHRNRRVPSELQTMIFFEFGTIKKHDPDQTTPPWSQKSGTQFLNASRQVDIPALTVVVECICLL